MLPKISLVGTENETHRRRVAESINGILDFTSDDSRRITDDEKKAGITPLNTAYPPLDLRRYGGEANGDRINDRPLADALLVAAQNDGTVTIAEGTWKFSSPIVLGNATTGRRLIGSGRPTLVFSSLGATDDCITQYGGVGALQTELRNFVIDCNHVGRDGSVLTGSDHPIIDNVIILNCVNDPFVFKVGGFDFIENGEFDFTWQDAGRHGIRFELNGSNGAFINECWFKQVEGRGVSKVTAGGQAIRITGNATTPGSKVSNMLFGKSNFDAQYTAGVGVPIPSTNIIEIDACSAENWRFVSGGWENTGLTSLAAGNAFEVSGTGAWNGLCLDSLLTNSFWGAQFPGVDPAITAVWMFNPSFGFTQLYGPVFQTTNPAFRAFLTSTTTNRTGGGVAYNLASYTESYDRSGSFDPTTGLFTALVTGLYEFTARVGFGPCLAGHTVGNLSLDINSGASVVQMSSQINPFITIDGSSNTAINGSIQIGLSAGDTVALRLTVVGSTTTIGAIGGTTITWFTGRFIG